MTLDATIGGPDSNAYVTVSEADDYWLDRENSIWTSATTAQKEAAIKRATIFIDSKYAGRFIGIVSDEDQALAWPRCVKTTTPGYVFESRRFYKLLDSEGRQIGFVEIPSQVKVAVYELALDALGNSDLFSENNAATIEEEKVKVGPIEQVTKYSSPVSQGVYRNVSMILRPLTKTRTLSRV